MGAEGRTSYTGTTGAARRACKPGGRNTQPLWRNEGCSLRTYYTPGGRRKHAEDAWKRDIVVRWIGRKRGTYSAIRRRKSQRYLSKLASLQEGFPLRL